MTTWKRVLGKLFGGAPDVAATPAAQTVQVIGGDALLESVERAVSQAVVRVGSEPLAPRGRALNLLEEPVRERFTGTAAAAIAEAAALSLAGMRASALLDGDELLAAAAQLAKAAARRAPLVVGVVARGGHDGLHALADRGAAVLVATTAQDAVDLLLVGRRVAEAALTPVVVALDGWHGASALADVRLPTAELALRYLGRAGDLVEPPTEAQRALLGARRARVPRWYDLDEPAVLGAPPSPEARGLLAAGAGAWLAPHVEACLEEAVAAFARLSGRSPVALRAHRVDDAEVVVVAQGAIVELLCAAADGLREGEKRKLGVVGVRALRPLPADELRALLAGRRVVAVVDRAAAPLAAQPPLAREIEALARGARLVHAVVGLGDREVRGADMRAWLSRLFADAPASFYPGVAFTAPSTTLPQREPLLAALSSGHPGVISLGESGPRGAAALPAGDDVSAVALAGAPAGFSLELGRLWHGLLGGHVRGFSSDVDVVLQGGREPRDGGDDVALDVVAVLSGSAGDALERLVEGGLVVVDGARRLSARDGAAVRARGATVLALPRAREGEPREERGERWLGALTGALARRRQLKVNVKRMSALRAALWAGASDDERARRGEALQRGFAELGEAGATATTAAEAPSQGAAYVPAAVRRLGERRPEGTAPALSLPNFWNLVGRAYSPDEVDPPLADPLTAVGAIPSSSSALAPAAARAAALPALRAAECSGCGRCWTLCPEAALAPIAIGGRALLEAGIEIAKAGGRDAEPLRQLVSKLAPRAGQALLKAASPPATARDWLAPAFDELLGKAGLPAERAEAATRAFADVMASVGALPVVKGAALFDEVERQAAGTGEVLSIALDADACSGCGVCVSSCEPAALALAPADDDAVARARAGFSLWEQLPDTPGATIARARAHADVGELPGMLLSRHCLASLARGDDMEPGSGARVALHLALARAEHDEQRRVQQRLQDLEELRGRLEARIEERLKGVLPGGRDLDALARALDDERAPSATLAAISARASSEAEPAMLDLEPLRRLTASARGAKELGERLASGAHGLGRARLGVVLAADRSTAGLARFPRTSLTVPAVVEPDEAVATALGIAEAHAERALELARLARAAALELKNPTEAALADAALRALSFDDLQPDERRACAPVLLVAASGALDPRALARLVRSPLPVKVLLLADGEGDDEDPLALLALARGRAYVAQSSLAALEHLGAALGAALQFDGPAIVQAYAPSPSRDGTAPDALPAQAELALASRAFPLFRFDPSRGGVLGACLDLEGNPSPASTWATLGDAVVTPFAWARSQRRYARAFAAPSGAEGELVDGERYLELDDEGRRDKWPRVVVTSSDGAAATTLVPSPALVADAEQKASAWRALLELAGVVTPFAPAARAELERSLAEAHAREVAALKAEHEAHLEDLRAEHARELVAKVQQRLLAIAGYTANGRTGDRPS